LLEDKEIEFYDKKKWGMINAMFKVLSLND